MPKRKSEILTAEESDKLAKIINDDSGIWTYKGYDNGLFCEDAVTPTHVYTSRAARNKKEIGRIVEIQTELELSKQAQSLKMVLATYDSSVLKKAGELQSKYDALLNTRENLSFDVIEIQNSVSNLRKKKSNLKSQERKLKKTIEYMENEIIVMQSPVNVLEKKVEKQLEDLNTIKSLEV